MNVWVRYVGDLSSFIYFVMFIYVKYLFLYLHIFYLEYSELPCDILWGKVFPSLHIQFQ